MNQTDQDRSVALEKAKDKKMTHSRRPNKQALTAPARSRPWRRAVTPHRLWLEHGSRAWRVQDTQRHRPSGHVCGRAIASPQHRCRVAWVNSGVSRFRFSPIKSAFRISCRQNAGTAMRSPPAIRSEISSAFWDSSSGKHHVKTVEASRAIRLTACSQVAVPQPLTRPTRVHDADRMSPAV